MTSSHAVRICTACAVENDRDIDVCAICADERQFVPQGGQRWTTLDRMRSEGFHVEIDELEPDLYGISSRPAAGIGQQSKLLRTEAGNLLWDPVGFVDDGAASRVRELGTVRAIVASHPHMYGVQVAWSHALGNVPVLVPEVDGHWIARPDPVIETWKEEVELLPGVTLSPVGGHFPGSSVVHWAGGAGGKGVLLGSDTIFVNADLRSVSFMRSFPNRLPLSGTVVARIAASVDRFSFDRLYGNFESRIDGDAERVVRRSAARHVAWVDGEFDDLT